MVNNCGSGNVTVGQGDTGAVTECVFGTPYFYNLGTFVYFGDGNQIFPGNYDTIIESDTLSKGNYFIDFTCNVKSEYISQHLANGKIKIYHASTEIPSGERDTYVLVENEIVCLHSMTIKVTLSAAEKIIVKGSNIPGDAVVKLKAINPSLRIIKVA